MATLHTLLTKIESLNPDGIARECLTQTEEQLIEKQKEQLLEGKNAKGEVIGVYKNELYADVKHRMNPLPGYGNADLKKSGGFYSGLYASVIGDDVVEDSSDFKTPYLEQRYGEEILGLNEEKKTEYVNEDLRPVAKTLLQKATGLL